MMEEDNPDAEVPRLGSFPSFLVGVVVALLILFTRTVVSYLTYGLRQRLFVRLNTGIMVSYNKISRHLKQELFSSLSTVKSHDGSLRENGEIRILEIGAGGGANFDFYPPKSKLVVVDPNPHFRTFFNANKSNYPNILLERFHATGAEDMTAIPDESVDVVISTIVLCSVKDPHKVVREIKRVLVKGGKYYYMEHIRAPNSRRILLILQKIVNLIGIWSYFGGGCELCRTSDDTISNAGFQQVDHKFVDLNFPLLSIYFYMPLIQTHVLGIAVK